MQTVCLPGWELIECATSHCFCSSERIYGWLDIGSRPSPPMPHSMYEIWSTIPWKILLLDLWWKSNRSHSTLIMYLLILMQRVCLVEWVWVDSLFTAVSSPVNTLGSTHSWESWTVLRPGNSRVPSTVLSLVTDLLYGSSDRPTLVVYSCRTASLST